MRKITIAMVAAAVLIMLSIPAFGYQIIWDPLEPKADLDINLQIDCWIQILWQDRDMTFDGASDWWSTQLMGLGYAPCPDDGGKLPPEPWAGDKYYAATGRYYESNDGAVIYVNSNNDLTMTVHTNGDLYGTINSSSNTIPTWFTVALCPFQIGGTAVAGHTVPFCGNPGCYLSDADGDQQFEYCHGSHDFPNQWVFPCEPASVTYTLGSMAPQVEGTIKFLARILRHGMADPGDQYYTYLDVAFSTP